MQCLINQLSFAVMVLSLVAFGMVLMTPLSKKRFVTLLMLFVILMISAGYHFQHTYTH